MKAAAFEDDGRRGEYPMYRSVAAVGRSFDLRFIAKAVTHLKAAVTLFAFILVDRHCG